MVPPAGEAGLILVLGGGVMPEVLGGGCWGLGAGSMLACRLGPLFARLAFGCCPGPAVVSCSWRLRLAGSRFAASSLYASRLALGALWLVAPVWALLLAAIFRLGMAEAGLVLPVSLAGVGRAPGQLERRSPR